MMRETSLDDHEYDAAAMDTSATGEEKSLNLSNNHSNNNGGGTIGLGSISLSHHRLSLMNQTSILQRDIGNNNATTSKNKIQEEEQEEGRDEEEKKQVEEDEKSTSSPGYVKPTKSIDKKEQYSPMMPPPPPPTMIMKDTPTTTTSNKSSNTRHRQPPPPQDYLRHMAATKQSNPTFASSAAATANGAAAAAALPTAVAAGAAATPPTAATPTTTTTTPKRAGTSWWERVVVQRSSYVVEDLVEQYTSDSNFLQSDPFDHVAFLDRIEIVSGDLLGAGTYSNVYRVAKLDLLPDFLLDHTEQNKLRQNLVRMDDDNNDDDGSDKARAGETTTDETSGGNSSKQDNADPIPSSAAPPSNSPPPPATTTTTTGTTGYAIKHLKSELLQNSKLFEAAAADLIMEAKFLSRLSHPNILRLRGMALGGSSTFSTTGLFDSYFLIVDELQETLIQRIHKWKLQGSTTQYQHAMILHKLKLAVQVASALSYLHERRLVFRDLKPHNIGLKRDGTIQLFDFGFCRELPCPSLSVLKGSRINAINAGAGAGASAAGNLPPEAPPSGSKSEAEEDDDEDKIYCMSGKGTLLYMASEVLSSRCYNAKADVYSWSMVTYELLTLQKPFAVGSIEQHKKAVCERGQRPPLHHLRWLSSGVKELLQHSWRANVQARWHMRDVKDALDDIIAELESSSQTSFSRDASFGYSNAGAFFCQGVEMDSIILDITNTVQTRYEYITNHIFCRGSTNGVVDDKKGTEQSGTKIPKTSLEASSDASKTPPTEVAMQQPAEDLKTEKATIAEEEEEEESVDKTNEKPDDKPASSNALGGREKDEKEKKKKTPVVPNNTGVGVGARGSIEEQRDDTFSNRVGGFAASMSTSFFGSTTPRMADTSEQFPMSSLCMHSVRLSAARNRPKVTAGNISHSMTDMGRTRIISTSGSKGSLNSVSPPRRASMSTLRQSADYGSGRIRQRRVSMPTSLGRTAEQGETLSASEGSSMNNANCVLQTIRSEEDEKTMDEVSLTEGKEDGEDQEPDDPASREARGLGEVVRSESGSQYHSAHEGIPQKTPMNDEGGPLLPPPEIVATAESPNVEKKKGNPQDDQSSHSGQFIPATASI